MKAVERTQNKPGDNVLIEVKHLKMYFPVTSGILVQRAVGYIKAVAVSYTHLTLPTIYSV